MGMAPVLGKASTFQLTPMQCLAVYAFQSLYYHFQCLGLSDMSNMVKKLQVGRMRVFSS